MREELFWKKEYDNRTKDCMELNTKLSAERKKVKALRIVLGEVVSSDMAMREEDEGRVSTLLTKVRETLSATEPKEV